MIYMGLDIATKTGVAIYDTQKHRASIFTTTIDLSVKKKDKGKSGGSEGKAWRLTPKLKQIITDYGQKPDYIVCEAPPKQVFKGQGNIHSTIELNVLVGAVSGALGLWGMPFQTVEPATWRKAMLGKGRVQGWSSGDWKQAAMNQCRMEGLPYSNDNEAEAVLIALWASTNSHRAQMVRIQQGKNH